MHYSSYQQGCQLFFKLLTDNLTASNEQTKESLLESAKAYNITIVPREDVQIVYNQLLVTFKTLCILNACVLPLVMIKFYLTICTTTGCLKFNKQFQDLKKQLQYLLLQFLI